MFKPNLLTILLIGFVDHLGIGLVYPVFAALLFDQGSDFVPPDATPGYRGAMLGLLIALTPLAQFFSSSILGAFSDRKGRRIALASGLLVGVFGYAIAIWGIIWNSLPLLMLYRFAVGLSDSTLAVGHAAIADISTEETKAKKFALFSSSAGFGFTIGPFIGGVMAEIYGYASPFAAAGLMCLVNLFLVLFIFPETRKTFEKRPFNVWEGVQSIQKIFLWKHLRALFLGGFALSFGWAFFNEFIPVLLKSRFSFSPGDVGNYYAIGGICYALSSGFGTTLLSKKMSPKSLVVTALVGSASSMLLYLLIEEAAHVWWTIPPLLFFLAIAYPTAAAIASNKASDDQQGEVMGAFNAVHAAAMGLSPLFMGSAVGIYPELAPLGGAAALLFSGLFFGVFVVGGKGVVKRDLESSIALEKASLD